jgi:hypothetical protein
VVEIMAVKIRAHDNIKGLKIDEKSKVLKLKQYADDSTLILDNIQDLENALTCVQYFSNVTGPKLNTAKCDGILLGPFKNQYIERCGISFTNNAVRCIGIYIGHDLNECYKNNCTDKITFFEQTLERWNRRHLTMFGKILIMKSLALSKLVYNFTVLHVPDEVKKCINKCMYSFIWSKMEKVKRKTKISTFEQGGLNMVDIDNFILTLNA